MSNCPRTGYGWLLAAAVLVVAGAGVRIGEWWKAPSLWLDEAKLALDIGDRGFAGLATPLANEQVAPVPYLWLTKLATLAFGMDERALRLVALVAGIGLLFVFARLAFRFLPPPAALVAVALCAFSPALVHYSNELKPYELDALITTAVLLLLDGAGARRAAIVAPIAAAASMISPFVVPAAAALCARRSRRPLLAFFAIGAAASVVYVPLYWFVYREVTTLPYMQEFWGGATFAPWYDWGKPLSAYRAVFGELWIGPALDVAQSVAVGVVLLAGVAGIVLRSRARALLLLAPIALTLIAALAGAYPVIPRLVVFAAPILLLVATEALRLAASPLPRGRALAILFAGAVIVYPGARATIAHAFEPRGDGAREAYQRVTADLRPGDTVYVGARAMATWLFYTTDWTRPDRARLSWFTAMGAATGPAFENAATRGRPVILEGDGLEYAWRGAREVLGVPTGQQFLMARSFRRAPDPGFFQNELRRLATWRSGRLWVVHSFDLDRVHGPLVNGLSRRARILSNSASVSLLADPR